MKTKGADKGGNVFPQRLTRVANRRKQTQDGGGEGGMMGEGVEVGRRGKKKQGGIDRVGR